MFQTPIFRMMMFIKPFSRVWFLSIVIDLIVSVMGLSVPLLIKVIFDYGLPFHDLSLVISMLTIGFCLNSVFFLGRVIQKWLSLYVSQSLFKRMYTYIFLKLNHTHLNTIKRYSVGDLLYRITDDSQAIEDVFISFIPRVLKLTLKVVIITAICLWIHPTITSVTLLGAPIYCLIQKPFGKRLKTLSESSKNQGAIIYNFLQERLNIIKLIKLHQKSCQQNKQLQQLLTGYYFIEKKDTITQLCNQFLMLHFHQFWMALMGGIMATLYIRGALTLGELMVLSTYIVSLIRPFKSLPSLMQTWKNLEVSLKRIDEIIQLKEEGKSQGEKWPLFGGIVINNVTFAYEGQAPIFKDLNLTIKPGETVAIVGKSGIGKSSLVDMILRFQDVQSGNVLLDGNDINNFSVEYLRKQIGLITADAPLLNTTILQNIAFSLEEKEVSQDRIIEASKLAGAHDFIEKLPEGYNTVVGPNGNCLSTGQKQRIAIARILVQDPKIVVFDEATSTLDSESEHTIQQTIFKLKHKKTFLLIAHRLSSIELADRVYVLGNEGHIVEQGTVPDLLQHRGIFYRLYHMQLGGAYQFQKQLRQRLIEMKYHQQKLCIAIIQSNLDELSASLTSKAQSQLMYDLNLTLSFLLPDVAGCFVKENTEWYVLVPAHNYSETAVLFERLIDYLNDSDFKGAFFKGKITECFSRQSVPECLSSLEEKEYVSHR